MHYVLSPQVRFLLLYIFDYIDEYLKGMNGDIRCGREGGCYVFKQPNKLSTDIKFKRCLEVVC